MGLLSAFIISSFVLIGKLGDAVPLVPFGQSRYLYREVSTPTLRLYDGTAIPGLALGTWLGNNTQGPIKATSNEVESAVSAALGLGYRHVDTASSYQIEDQVGRALDTHIKHGLNREKVFITTKLANNAHARAAVVPALRRSLDKLGLQYVDLYLVHWPLGQFTNQSYDYTDYLDTWRGMVEAKQLGLARAIGVSNFNAEQLNRILQSGLEKPAVLQVEVNLNLQQSELLQYCKNHDIVVMAYTPFGSMFPSRARAGAPPPRVDDPKLLAIGERYNKTSTQVVLRYLLDLGVIPIPKALNAKHLESNIAVFDFTLSEADRAELKSFDAGYRTVPQLKWLDHPYYPFEKPSTAPSIQPPAN